MRNSYFFWGHLITLWWLSTDLPDILANIDCLKTFLYLLKGLLKGFPAPLRP